MTINIKTVTRYKELHVPGLVELQDLHSGSLFYYSAKRISIAFVLEGVG